MLTVLPLGFLFYMHGSLSAETFITVIILALGYGCAIVAAFNFVDTLAQVGTTVSQVDEILKAEEQQHGTERVTFENHDIEMKDVSFGYHDDKEILHGVTLSVGQNGMTALVGPSGSGKSTLAKLMAGFWDVKNGVITMGGHDLKQIPLEQLYDQVAFVSQDNYLFDDTVRENTAWDVSGRPTPRWKRLRKRPAAKALSASLKTATTRASAEQGRTFRAASASALPLHALC